VLGGLLSLLSAVMFAYANASMRRGVLRGTVMQAVAISLPVALPLFLIGMALTGGFPVLWSFSWRSLGLLALAGIIHFVLGRHCNYRATKAMGANLVAPVQQFSLVVTLVLAVVWLGETFTVLRMIGIALVVFGPGLVLRRDKRAIATNGSPGYEPNLAEGYTFAILSAIGFGISPILIAEALHVKTIGSGIAGGFVSYVAATIALAVPLLLPGQWASVRALDRTTGRWFVVSGIAIAMSQMTRYMALAVAPVSVVTPIQRLTVVFQIYFGALVNPEHEVFGERLILGTVISLIGAVALSVSLDEVSNLIALPPSLATVLGWHWP
jgi:uncharacterized membrane protein